MISRCKVCLKPLPSHRSKYCSLQCSKAALIEYQKAYIPKGERVLGRVLCKNTKCKKLFQQKFAKQKYCCLHCQETHVRPKKKAEHCGSARVHKVNGPSEDILTHIKIKKLSPEQLKSIASQCKFVRYQHLKDVKAAYYKLSRKQATEVRKVLEIS